MGYQKNKEPLKFKDYIKIFITLIIVLGGFGTLITFTIKEENKAKLEQELIDAAYVHPDTLIISKDLRNKSNLNKFIEKEYPLYKIYKYKHVDSEYSAWNGTHNFYEFILIKK